MYNGQSTSSAHSLVARSQNILSALFLSELKDANMERNRRNSEFFFTTIPLQIWEFYLLDEFLNSTALAEELRTKVTGLEFTALRTTRSHTISLHPSAHIFAGQFSVHKTARDSQGTHVQIQRLGAAGGAGGPIFPRNSPNLTCQEHILVLWNTFSPHGVQAGLETWSPHKNPACPSYETFSVAQKSLLGWAQGISFWDWHQKAVWLKIMLNLTTPELNTSDFHQVCISYFWGLQDTFSIIHVLFITSVYLLQFMYYLMLSQ